MSEQTPKTVEHKGCTWHLMVPSNIDTEIEAGRDWEPIVTRWILDFLKPGMVAVDAGANIGWFTVLMSKAVAPAGKVIAIEPCKRFLDRLERNIGANHLENVRVFDLALFHRTQEMTCVLNQGPYFSSAVVAVGHNPAIGELTVGETLDRIFCGHRLDLLKIDIDGDEDRALMGAAETIQMHRPRIAIEVANREPVRILSDWGYDMVWEKGNRRVTPNDLPISEANPTINLLCTPK